MDQLRPYMSATQTGFMGFTDFAKRGGEDLTQPQDQNEDNDLEDEEDEEEDMDTEEGTEGGRGGIWHLREEALVRGGELPKEGGRTLARTTGTFWGEHYLVEYVAAETFYRPTTRRSQ